MYDTGLKRHRERPRQIKRKKIRIRIIKPLRVKTVLKHIFEHISQNNYSFKRAVKTIVCF